MKLKQTPRAMLALLAATLASPAATALHAAPAGAAETASAPAADAMMARVEQRIATLHAQLQITAAEEPQWQQFAVVMRENAQKMEQNAAKRAETFRSLNAVENMKSYAEMAAEHGQNMQRLATVFESVYNVLSPAQKKIADEVFQNRAMRRQQRHRG